jgi:hypothetical protein
MSLDLATARNLETGLLAYSHQGADTIVHPEDKSTPVWHLTNLAVLYKYVGLLQLYRVFPDILSDRLSTGDGDALVSTSTDKPPLNSAEGRRRWLTDFSLEALRILETMPIAESGTKDFQPFLLVMLSSELVCGNGTKGDEDADPRDDINIDSRFGEVAVMRKMILDRLNACLQLLPPKFVRVLLNIVQETWRRIDAGEADVYWLDVMIQNGWETIMA